MASESLGLTTYPTVRQSEFRTLCLISPADSFHWAHVVAHFPLTPLLVLHLVSRLVELALYLAIEYWVHHPRYRSRDYLKPSPRSKLPYQVHPAFDLESA